VRQTRSSSLTRRKIIFHPTAKHKPFLLLARISGLSGGYLGKSPHFLKRAEAMTDCRKHSLPISGTVNRYLMKGKKGRIKAQYMQNHYDRPATDA